MKKSLIAMAVLAASGVASAQSTVTLYGLVDAYVGSTKPFANAGSPTQQRRTVLDSGGFNGSRFGLKGSEDLGGGLKANFVLEGGYDTSTGAANNFVNYFGAAGNTANATFGRQSWVGLSGGFGELKLGKMWTPYDEVKGSGAGAFDANIFAPAANVWQSNGYQANPGNSIYYSTPSFSGFSAAASYSFGENKTATQDAGKIISANLQYAGGPIAAALAYQTEKQGGLLAANTTRKFTQVNASYDFQVVKLLAAYGNVKDGGDKTNEYQIGVDVPLGSALTVSGGVAGSKTQFAAGPDSKRTGVGVAAKYSLSKRTFLYTGLQATKEKVAGLPDGKGDTFAVGVQHKF